MICASDPKEQKAILEKAEAARSTSIGTHRISSKD